MIKNVVFDIGNVLISFSMRQELEKAFGSKEEADRLYPVIFSKYWRDCDRGIITLEEQIRSTCELSPKDSEAITKLLSNRVDMFIPVKDSENVVKELKKAGFGVYYNSNTSFDAIEGLSKKLGYFDIFDGGVISCAEKCTKADNGRNLFTVFLEKYPLDPKECVFVDDTINNVESAQRAGFNTVHLKKPELLREELKKFDDIKNVL